MDQSKKGIVAVIVIVVVLVVGYFVSKGPSEPVSTGPIKIGFIAPLTGDAATYGEMARNLVQLVIKEINASGEVKNPIEIIYEDGKCSGKDAINAMQKLVNVDKVKVVLGGFCSSESLAVVHIANENKVLLVSAGSSSPDLTAISKYFVRNYPSDATQGSVLAKIAIEKGWKKVAFIQEQLDYPLGIYKAFSAEFEKRGGIVIKEEFPTTVTDVRSQLTKLRAEKSDALFIDTQTPASGERVLKQVKDLKWKIPLLVSDAVVGDVQVVKNNAVAMEGALAAEFGVDPNNLQFKGMLEKYQKEYGVEIPFQSYAQTYYDAVFMIKDALVAVDNDVEKMAEWFRVVKDWSGASGLTTIGDDGDRDGGHTPKIIKNGKVELYK